MDLKEFSLPLTNAIASKYVGNDVNVRSFFDYTEIENQQMYLERSTELANRVFPRESLVQHLLEFHTKFSVANETIKNIAKLKDPASVVVIGGQQAGLLTGPLYTIHKIISIIKLAKEQEELLDVPVVPVFWVAGEDHDFDEINHVFISEKGAVKKTIISQRQYEKSPASFMKIDKNLGEEWIRAIFHSFGETNHTKELLKIVVDDLQQSTTYVDFFIRTIYRLFPNQGLVVVDSGDAGFRQIGSQFTQQLIERNTELGEKVLASQLALKEMGYGEPIDINEKNAHLFYIHNGERLLLERNGHQFSEKNKKCIFDKRDLLELAATRPHLLCNNVVTRPLMQEYIFPTLAFISGPGEIAYWSTLKQAFHLFNFKVPPIVPRLMMTIVERQTAKYIQEKALNLAEILENGCLQQKESWLNGQRIFDLDQVMDDVIGKVMSLHQPLQSLVIEIDSSLESLAKKNAEIICSQLLFLKEKMEKSLRTRHEVELRKFDHINLSIRPVDSPQERIWNIFYYINQYGIDFVEELIKIDYKWNGHHKVILL